MKLKTVFRNLGKILMLSAVFYVFPIIVSLIYGEYDMILAFALGAGISLFVGLPLFVFCKTDSKIRVKEGLTIVGLSWLLISAIGALPLTVSKVYDGYIDSLFEMVSGFTTTGATVLIDFDVPYSVHFWRCFSHWLGGMGILVFLLAVTPSEDASDFQLMKFEAPGPTVGKLVSKLRYTATILYIIYFAFTFIEFAILKIGGLPWFDSIVISLSTAGTGGFATTAESIAGYNSVFVDVVVTVFMFLFSINFNLYFLISVGKIGSAIKDEELRFFLCFVFGAILSITLYNTYAVAEYGTNFFTALRYSAFSVVAVSSTTGFATANFAEWDLFPQTVILLVMIVGGMAGSTGGGLKASRALILLKATRADSLKTLRPNGVYSVKLNKKPLDQETVSSVKSYFVLAVLIIVITTIFLSFDGASDNLLTSLTASITCFNNVGPGLGNIVGPVGNFSSFSPLSKIVLSFTMLIGRLEIYPIFLLFTPKTWSKSY